MDQEETGQFGSAEATHNLWLFFKKNVDLLEQAHHITLQNEGSSKWTVLSPLLYATIDTSKSILYLARQGKVRDCFVLARTVFETIVNIGFICAKEDEVAERARRHANQKAYRDLNRMLEINGNKVELKWSGVVDLEQHPELQAALAEFTSRKGREITSWTPETVQEEIEAIAVRYGSKVSIKLQFALISIYRHASEITHGTFYGALFALGLVPPHAPPNSREELESYQRENLSMVLMMLGLSISAILSIFVEEVSSLEATSPLKELASQAKRAIAEIRKQPWAKDTMPE